MISLEDIPLGLYIHLPWCIRKCPYCDFNSHEKSGELPFDRYVDCLIADLNRQLPSVNERTVSSIFIGGGTPSLFPAAAIRQLMDRIRSSVSCATNMEVTLEANPGAADAARFAGYLDAGVNRLSIGVQSFRDRQLKLLGRVHSANDARDAYLAARSAGFSNINIDIMHGLPEDDVEENLSDLRSALDLQPEHISWYQLTVESGTAFARKPPQLPSHDDVAEQFDQGRALLESAGFRQLTRRQILRLVTILTIGNLATISELAREHTENSPPRQGFTGPRTDAGQRAIWHKQVCRLVA